MNLYEKLEVKREENIKACKMAVDQTLVRLLNEAKQAEKDKQNYKAYKLEC